MVKKYKHKILLSLLALACFILAVIGAIQTSADPNTRAPTQHVGFVAHSAVATIPPTFTVGQTISVGDLEMPVTRPADAAQPPSWTSRVIFKGCGQNASVRMHVSGRLLIYNGGTVNRYIRSGVALPPSGSHLIVPKDWRLLTFNSRGIYVLTFTSSYCTLWAPKIVVTVS